MRRREFLQGLGAAVLGLLLPKGKVDIAGRVPESGKPGHRVLDNLGITWLLRDEFTDMRVGVDAVNGTLATPGPGMRLDYDTAIVADGWDDWPDWNA